MLGAAHAKRQWPSLSVADITLLSGWLQMGF
jgi:hypothetical protein